MPKPLIVWNGNRMDHQFSLEMGQITNWLRRPISLKFHVTTLPFKLWCNSWANDCWVCFALLLQLGVANGTCVDVIWITPRSCLCLKGRLMLSISLIRWLGLEAIPRVETDSHIWRMAEQQKRVWITDTVEPPHHLILLVCTQFGDFCLWLFMCLFLFCLKSLEGFSKNIFLIYLFSYA